MCDLRQTPFVGLLQLGADGHDVSLQLGLLLSHPLTQRVALLHLRGLLLHPQLQLALRLLLDGGEHKTKLCLRIVRRGSEDRVR